MNIYNLKNGKSYIVKTDLSDVLNKAILDRFDIDADDQLRRLRFQPIEKIMNRVDKTILTLTGQTSHVISLLKLKREIDEFVTYDSATGGRYTFEIGCNHECFYIINKSFSPYGFIKTEYDSFIEVCEGHKTSFIDLYASYTRNTTTKPPLSLTAFNRKIRDYYPHVTDCRLSDPRRRRGFIGIRIKE